MKRILVAVDGSEGADRAVDYAAQQAKDHGAELLIVNIIGGQAVLENVFLRATQGEQVWLKETLESLSTEALARARGRALTAGLTGVQFESRSGDVAETILAVAAEKGADLIVAGKRGLGRVRGALLGSVSQKLVSLAPVAVTVVP